MDKYLKYGIVFAMIFILLILINKLITPPMDEQIKNYLLNTGFQEDLYDKALLTKNISNTTTDAFNVADYTFSQKVNDYSSNVESTLNETYDFKNHELKFNYRTKYSDNINIIFKGNYVDGIFSCDKEFSTATINQEEMNNTCNLIRIKVERFYNESQALFNNYHFIDYMEHVDIE